MGLLDNDGTQRAHGLAQLLGIHVGDREAAVERQIGGDALSLSAEPPLCRRALSAIQS